MKTWVKHGLIFSLVIGLGMVGWYHLFTRGELGSKAEWGFLQKLESDFREARLPRGIILIRMDNHDLLGVPAIEKGTIVWVLLDAHAEPSYKQMPGDEDYRITQNEYERILAFGSIRPEVIARLRDHLVNP